MHLLKRIDRTIPVFNQTPEASSSRARASPSMVEWKESAITTNAVLAQYVTIGIHLRAMFKHETLWLHLTTRRHFVSMFVLVELTNTVFVNSSNLLNTILRCLLKFYLMAALI